MAYYSCIFTFLIFFLLTLGINNRGYAQLSGEVDLGGGSTKSEAAPAANIKEITVNGMGTTLESAEKQALAAAIRQAVGAYMDSKTIVENEEVIQDRILLRNSGKSLLNAG
jgi:hypothetical protein